jgi:hypothetical protein
MRLIGERQRLGGPSSTSSDGGSATPGHTAEAGGEEDCCGTLRPSLRSVDSSRQPSSPPEAGRGEDRRT